MIFVSTNKNCRKHGETKWRFPIRHGGMYPSSHPIFVGFALFNMFKPSIPMGSPIYENPQVSHLSQLSDLSELPAAHIRHVLPLQWPRSTWARHHCCLAAHPIHRSSKIPLAEYAES